MSRARCQREGHHEGRREARHGRALLLGLLVAALAFVACDDGKPGEEGEPGEAGTQPGPRGPVSEEEGEEGGEGPEGPQGPGTDVEPSPALSTCFPGVLYLGHATTLTVSGDDTAWIAGDVDLELGGGVSVDELLVASPTALVADVSVDLDAEPGDVEVVVTGAGSELSLVSGVEVLPSIVLQAEAGAVANGSSFLLDLALPDVSAPVDPTRVTVEIPDAEGLSPRIVSASPYAVRVRVDADVFADVGAFDLVLHSGGEGVETSSRAPSGLSVAQRAPETLDLLAMPVDVDAPGAAGSHLYAFTPPDPLAEVKLDLVVSGGSGLGEPRMIVIPPSGLLQDPVASGITATFLPQGDDPYFVLVIDETGADDYVYDLVATVTAAAPTESEPNDVCGGPGDVVSAFPTSFVASLADEGDEDWFQIDLDALEGGLRLRSRTTAGDADTDVELTVFADDCTTIVGGPRDIDFHENLIVGPLAEGTWFVRVRPSPTFPFAGSLYKMAFTLEP